MRIRLSDHFTYKKILKFTFPPMIMMVFTSLYGVVDGLFVTNFEGKSALAAINFVYPILNILATFGYMFGAGGSALVAKTLGEGKSEKANKLFSLFVYVCALLGVVFSVVGFFILRPLMQSLGAEGVMLDQAVMYGNILLISLPVWNLQFLFQIFFVTAEKPQLGLPPNKAPELPYADEAGVFVPYAVPLSVEEQKLVREELVAKEKTMDDIQGKIAKTKNEIAEVKGKISAIVNSVGENTLKTIASELTTLTPQEKAEDAEEARKEAEKIAANDPLAAIRDSLDKIERELTDTIQENRIETV